jgi:predicted permease
MSTPLSDLLAHLSVTDVTRIRLISMFIVLLAGLTAGYVTTNRLQPHQELAKKIMTLVLVCLNWPIALLVIWNAHLTVQFIWLPIAGLILMLTTTALTAILFSFFELDPASRLTLILAGGLSNVGYTGGAFVCYALFGMTGLALANIYLLLVLPTFYLIYLPLLKVREMRAQNRRTKSRLNFLLDSRMLAIPAIITAIILNLTGIKQPAFITKFHLIDILVYSASSLSFFAIGLQVKLSRLKDYISLYFPLAAVKFILAPAVALLLITILALAGQRLEELVQNVIMVLAATPSAVLMVTMSNVFDLDGQLASALWVVTTAVFVILVVPVLFLAFT